MNHAGNNSDDQNQSDSNNDEGKESENEDNAQIDQSKSKAEKTVLEKQTKTKKPQSKKGKAKVEPSIIAKIVNAILGIFNLMEKQEEYNKAANEKIGTFYDLYNNDEKYKNLTKKEKQELLEKAHRKHQEAFKSRYQSVDKAARNTGKALYGPKVSIPGKIK